jgi:hypothetical protein
LGLLVETTSIDVSIAPDNVDEDSTVTMDASISYDDGTTSDVSGQGVFARNVGPVDVTDAGTIYVGAVSTDEQGEVTISYLGVSASDSFTIVNSLPDNYGSYASDGIPDSWQINYFGESNPLGLAAADPDGDGQNNLLEFLAGNIPTDASSAIRVQIEKVGQNGLAVVINKVVSGRTYTLESNIDLASDWTPVESKIVVEDELDFSFSTTQMVGGQTFYRVKITD